MRGSSRDISGGSLMLNFGDMPGEPLPGDMPVAGVFILLVWHPIKTSRKGFRRNGALNIAS